MDKQKPNVYVRIPYIRPLIESSMLVAIAYILSWIAIFQLPSGGKITVLSMLPILLIGIRHGGDWGLGSALVYSCLQIFQSGGLYAPIYPTPTTYAISALLDYILAFSVLGLSAVFRSRKYGLFYASLMCLTLRFLCHFVSGVFIWSEVPGNIDAWKVSLTYNGAYMGVELLETSAVAYILCKTAPMLLKPQTVREKT